jgi:hypothetical protein
MRFERILDVGRGVPPTIIFSDQIIFEGEALPFGSHLIIVDSVLRLSPNGVQRTIEMCQIFAGGDVEWRSPSLFRFV